VARSIVRTCCDGCRLELGSIGGRYARADAWQGTSGHGSTAYNWTGWYIRLNAGYGFGGASDPKLSFFDGSGTGFAAYVAAGGNVFPNVIPAGFIGGGQLGYNWHISPQFVVGFVVDFQGSDIQKSGVATVTPPLFVTTTQRNALKIDWFGTVRGKLGYAADNVLFYATGGAAYGHVKSSSSLCISPPFAVCGVGLSYAGTSDETKFGWTIGAGIDFGFANWVLGAEYLYYDLGSVSNRMTSTNGIAPLTTMTIKNAVDGHLVRATVSYRF